MPATGRSEDAPAPDQRQAALDEWAEAFALILERGGLPRMAGRVFAHLLVADPPERSAAQLAADVRASRGSISTITRLLVGAGLIERRRHPGVRFDEYRVAPQAAESLVDAQLAWVRRLNQTAAAGLPLIADRAPGAGERLAPLVAATEAFEVEGPLRLAHWVGREPSAKRSQAGGASVAERRAGKVPHVKMPGGGSAPRDRNRDGTWRKKRSDAGKPNAKSKR